MIAVIKPFDNFIVQVKNNAARAYIHAWSMGKATKDLVQYSNMKLVPLLAIQRGLYSLPVQSRFGAYLDTMYLPNRQDLRYPLANMNPMAKAHVHAFLDQLLEQNAEDAAQEMLEEVVTNFPQLLSLDLSLGLVVVDDAQGGWTDRVDVDIKNTFQRQGMLQRKWVEAILWSGDEKDSESLIPRVKSTVALAIYRTACSQKEGNVIATLGDMMKQESWVWKQSWKHSDTDTADRGQDMESALTILKQHQHASIEEDYPTVVAAFYGDQAAEARGHPTLGTKEWNGQKICRLRLWNFE